jgi:gamma-glutamyltranspeptidase
VSKKEIRGWPWLGDHEPYPRLPHARPVLAEFGMVSTPHYLATRIGVDILRAGGNAIDSAIAASAALMVTLPMQCSLGGDAVWLIREPDGTVASLDATGRSPKSASADKLRSQGLTSIPLRSAHAVTVPGAVNGWIEALRRYGTRSLMELLEPAACLAERGFFVSRHLHASFCAALPVLNRTGAMGLWSTDGLPPPLYTRLRQPQLAEALRSIARTEGRSLYEGSLARQIVEAVNSSGAEFSREDLASYQAEWGVSLSTNFRGLMLHTTPPPTQGASLLEAAAIVERLSLQPLDPTMPESVHIMIEAVSLALEDRDRFIGDRKPHQSQLMSLFEPSYIASIAEYIDARQPRNKKLTTSPARNLGGTAHLAVVDADRRAVSLIQSLFFDFGTGIPVRSGGFTLQNRGAAFSLQAGSINELAPNSRPRTTLMPTLACMDSQLSLVLGCIQTQLQLLVAMLDAKLDPQQAVASPRWYLDRGSGSGPRVLLEEGYDLALIEGLREIGHETLILGPAEEIMGHAQVIAVQRTGALVGAADGRSDGQVAGW